MGPTSKGREGKGGRGGEKQGEGCVVAVRGMDAPTPSDYLTLVRCRNALLTYLLICLYKQKLLYGVCYCYRFCSHLSVSMFLIVCTVISHLEAAADKDTSLISGRRYRVSGCFDDLFVVELFVVYFQSQ